MSTKPIETAADVYRSLVSEGLMLRKDGSGRDDALWHELIVSLGLPTATDNIPKALEDNGITIEQFIRAFFLCFEPFSRMMVDICQSMEAVGATDSYNSMAIKYNFSENDEVVDFSLLHFRDFWKSYSKIYTRLVYRIWSTWDIREFLGDLDYHSRAYQGQKDQTDDFSYHKWQPNQTIPQSWASDKELFSAAKIIANLHKTITSTIKQDSATFDANLSILHKRDIRDKQRHGDMEQYREFLAHQEVSVWEIDVNEMAKTLEMLSEAHKTLSWIAWRRTEETPIFEPEYKHGEPNELLVILDHYDDLPTEERTKESLVEEIHEILNLPVWRYRWQLYQVWVGMFVLRQLEQYGIAPQVYAEDGRLELYEHHPAHLADINGCKKSIAFWAELQTLLSASTDGSKSIRPDYSLSRIPETRPENTLLIVEAKQRKKMPPSDLESLIRRYEAGCPEGHLLIVNYDAFPPVNREHPNTEIISNFRPDNDAGKRLVCKQIAIIARAIKAEQEEEAERIKTERETDEQKTILNLIEQAEDKLKGIEFVRGIHSTHAADSLGAIVLDCRDVSHSGAYDRYKVVQYLRANPLAQVWLAGTDFKPKLAYDFDYDNDRTGHIQVECDLVRLLQEIRGIVKGTIVVMGYSSAIGKLPYFEGVKYHTMVG
jgi:hypothetical protein